MKLDTPSFRGMVPRLTPRALPDNASQNAVNCRLVSGDLEAWNQFAETERLGITPMTIYRLNGAWLAWTTDVDVARGIIPGDDTFRIYLTGPDEYSTPRWTNYALAVSSPGGHPAQTRPLGVPNPDSVPTWEIGVDPASTTFDVEVFDYAGDIELWTLSPAVNAGFDGGYSFVSAVNSSASPSFYRLNIDGGDDDNFRSAYMYRDFRVENSAQITFSGDFRMTEANDAGLRQMVAHVANDADGNGITVHYYTIESTTLLNIGLNSGGWAMTGSVPLAVQILASVNVGVLTGPTAGANGSVANPNTGWYHLEVTVSAASTDEQTVTATLYEGVEGSAMVLLGTVSATSRFTLGGYCGMSFAHNYDSDNASTWIDWATLHVTGDGERGALNIDPTTSYVFTYVNDVDEESGPSLPSEIVTRPTGVSVAITTPTDTPTGTSSEYGIVSKRIYRAATGNTGTVFRFVAEIPLAQAIYDDVLTDAQLGEVLETELFALPPDDLRGIIALPNGIMAGFRRNQLCLSARNHPHAWPVEYRLNTDTDIVGIANIDSTIVIGTESFPYLAGGNDPSAFSMTKLEVPQACVAKRSFAYLTNIGVVFASPDGLIAVAGTGQVRNLTETVFSRRQWQALEPTTILGVAHDDVYHFWFGTVSSAVSAWNTTNESGSWTFTNNDFTAATP
jgi:hypothetical protein